VLGLLPGNAEIRSGRIMLEGTDIVRLGGEELRQMRGRRVALIPQDPLQSLNPTLTVGRQMADAMLAHAGRRGRDRRALRHQMVAMLQRVGIPDAADRVGRYPHQFSGGMRQRILIATALLLGPAVLVADEPTSALDVTLEAQILELLRGLRDERGTSILFVTHNVGVVAQLVDRVIVMYAGRVVESADVKTFFAGARHPYAQALLGAVPTHEQRNRRLTTIPGRVPNLAQLPAGCAFADRCPLAAPVCRTVDPLPVADGASRVRCHARDAHSGWQAPAGAA
jgi:oligopeptide/dipeptide ABC transporter ATP-binding protein